jgi:dihydrofolate reductase
LNLVLTRSGVVPFDGMVAVASIEEAVQQASAQAADELCVIGGGEIYALVLARADVLHLTHVETEVAEADAFFPRFNPADWEAITRQAHPADARHVFAFAFVDYARRR